MKSLDFRSYLQTPLQLTICRARMNLPLITAVVIYITVFSVFTVNRYNCFLTNAYDLGLFNQAFWTTLHGRLFYETMDLPLIPSGSFLGVHFAPLLFFLLPIYAIHPSPETLLVLQSVFVALGAIPIYFIAHHILESREKAFAFSCLYLTYPAIHSLNIYDFHLEAFVPFFLLSSYCCFLKKKWVSYWIFVFFSFITIDFAPILIGAISLVSLLSMSKIPAPRIDGRLRIPRLRIPRPRIVEKSTRVALLSILVCIVSLLLILQASIYFSGKNNDVVSILSGFLTAGRRAGLSGAYMHHLQFWLFQGANLLFLPLFAPAMLVTVAPWFFVSLLSSAAVPYYILGYQYAGSFVAPGLFIASIYGAKKLFGQDRKNWHLAFAGMFAISMLVSPLNPLTEHKVPGIAYEGYPRKSSHIETLNQVLALIPGNASVYTINNLFPQLSSRENAYVYLPNGTDVEYVLTDQRSGWRVHRIHGPSMDENLPELMKSGDYGTLAQIDGVVLLKRGYTGDVLLPEKIYEIYNFHNLSLLYGSKVRDTSSLSGTVLTHAPEDQSGTFWFGPYITLPPGRYSATFRLKAENLVPERLLSLRVTSRLGTVVLADLELNGSYFPWENSWQNFTLEFDLSQEEVGRQLGGPTENLEFVGIVTSTRSRISLDYIQITKIQSRET